MSPQDARPKTPVAIKLDDDDDGNDDGEDEEEQEAAQLHIDPRAPTEDAPSRDLEQHGDEGDMDDGQDIADDDDSSDDEDLDLDNLLKDVIEAEGVDEENVDQDGISFEVCTSEEVKKYRALLAQQGPDEFILHTVTAGSVTPRKLCTAFGVPKSSLARLADMLDTGDNSEEGEAAILDVWYRLLGLAIMRFVLTRHKLSEYNTIDDVATLLRTAKNILVITGAGISTNLGIPDFRSKNTGFYAKLAEQGFDDPTDVFDLDT